MKRKFGILKNEFDEGHLNWQVACSKFDVAWETIDLVGEGWLKTIISDSFDGFLACPPGREALFKKLYDERIYIIEKVLNAFVYPSYEEISIHENKKYLSYWLRANNLPFPMTFVFYNKNEALKFTRDVTLPIVGKMNIGASGKGVKVFKDRESLVEYINLAFERGLRGEWGPNLKMGGYTSRLGKILSDPKRIVRRLQVYKKNYNAIQKGFVIFQEYISHDYEWRVVKIGDSYFGHKKVKQGDKASGTKGIDYVALPDNLLNFVKGISSDHHFNSMAFDLFEDEKAGYLINELQCIFGHVQEYICAKNGKPGRYRYLGEEWVFEEGMFNTNLSYDLRLEDALKQFQITK